MQPHEDNNENDTIDLEALTNDVNVVLERYNFPVPPKTKQSSIKSLRKQKLESSETNKVKIKTSQQSVEFPVVHTKNTARRLLLREEENEGSVLSKKGIDHVSWWPT